MVLCEVKVAFDVQQGLLEEGQPADFVLLALVEHLLHALHVLWGALIQLLQRLLIFLFSLRQKTEIELQPLQEINPLKRTNKVIISIQIAAYFLFVASYSVLFTLSQLVFGI